MKIRTPKTLNYDDATLPASPAEFTDLVSHQPKTHFANWFLSPSKFDDIITIALEPEFKGENPLPVFEAFAAMLAVAGYTKHRWSTPPMYWWPNSDCQDDLESNDATHYLIFERPSISA